MSPIVLTTSPSFDIDKAIARVGGQTGQQGPSGRDEKFYFEDIWIKVESTIFKVHRRYLENESTIFKDMFTVSAADSMEGKLDEHPLFLESIRYQDFEALLKVLIDREYRSDDTLKTDEWLSVLKLADIYDMVRIRQKAIDELKPLLDSDPALRVLLAIRYNIDTWLEPAVQQLARRPEPLSMADYAVLGADTTIKMGRVREAYTPHCKGCPLLPAMTKPFSQLVPRGNVFRFGNPALLPPLPVLPAPAIVPKAPQAAIPRDEFDFMDTIRQVFTPQANAECAHQ